MSHPPQPPSGQQWPNPQQGWGGPPSGPPIGPPGFPPQGPPGFPPQGPPGFGQYGGGFGGPPKKSRTGLVIGLVVGLVVLLIIGIVVTAVLVTGGDDGDDKAGKDRSSASSTSTTDGTPSPTDPSSATTPATPYSPTEDEGTDDPAAHIDVEAAEFADDWDFKFGDVEHKATYLESWKYDTCGPVEEGSALTQQRCEYAVQWTYSALGGKARVTYIALVFDTEAHAKAADASLSDKDFDLRAEAQFPNFVQGKWNSGVVSNVVGVTVGTTKTKVDEKRLQSLVNYMTTDYKLALQFKQF
ncbi:MULTISPECIES: hypothetical protein [unclassified Nocardioides]|uniref:hypothetical protein n=1 Tax=unclassified Nocardioides TaxID=2615069 RepID=UPI0006FBD7DF|nr:MULTISPECIES: hypothetical protein [unclassified Nocardioides]KRA38899.1 hypothetical protein ASD81_10000 [Nocardioides sp. Root614]KRA92859.1 hypothetical protein ASD84_10265 [Nocardioides sp. Root682]